MKLFFKKIVAPKSNEAKQVDAVQTWSVRWTSRNGAYHCDTKPVAEFFTSEQQAKEFAESLRAAFKLVRNTSESSVSINKED